MTLTRTVTALDSATTYTARECIGAGVPPGLQILCRHGFATRVAASAQRTASVRNSTCADASAPRKPGTGGANALPVVANAVAKGAA